MNQGSSDQARLPVPQPPARQPDAPPDAPPDAQSAAGALLACANCGAPALGRYCAQCGQRIGVHMHSVAHFTSEAAEVLTHSDSSLWKTLWPLLMRPGWLTKEFVAGRRVRYLHPFRLYLVASVLFFLVVHFVGGDSATVAQMQGAPARPVASAEHMPDCEAIRSDVPGLQPKLVATCRQIEKDGGRQLGREFGHNLGRAMFVFLPALAAFMKLLYWRPRRWYLEHLLLLLHNHAFLFLFAAIVVLAAHWLPGDFLPFLAWLGACGYALRYLYKSMRNYYGQARALTLGKFALLGCAYLVAGLAMLAITSYISIADA